MEFVEGETLEKLIRCSGRLEVKLALGIATQVATGLGAIHERNLVHRDIKPTNIMVMLKEGGTVAAKIIDLGLAKTVDKSASEAGISSPGAFAGTPEFARSGAIRWGWRGHPLGSVLDGRDALGDGDWPNTIPRYFR
jgi:serine/threonine-protein kinase